MSTGKRNPAPNEWEMSTIGRKYSVPPVGGGAPPNQPLQPHLPGGPGELQAARGERGSTSEDLHAWSIYRQNLNSDFTDSALGSSEKSPLPYGNFQLRESTVQSILNHPRYGPKSALSSNMYTYLKFGLPRVFPPTRGRDGSSGYDSSEDGSPGPHKILRGPTRARSEQDFRNLAFHSTYRPSQGRNVRAKSSSEANLLSMGHYYHQEPPRTRHSMDHGRQYKIQEQRKSFHDLRPPPSIIESNIHSQISSQRRSSKAGPLNQRKLPQSRSHSVMGEPVPEPIIFTSEVPEQTTFQYPHLQVRNLDIEAKINKIKYLIQGVSFEVRGGELLAVMSTQTQVGTLILESLGRSGNKFKTTSQIILNGNVVSRKFLSKVTSYVNNESDWDADLTPRQLLHFHHSLRKVSNVVSKSLLNDKITGLIDDLGLDQISNTKLSGLTNSELRRLNVALHLLLDVDILILDQPTKGMDIFDTFFLIEYLRQWTMNRAAIPGTSWRSVILTLQPPTYEILTMISQILLVANGQVMYSGPTHMLLPYFTNIEYPCPSFKNPSDYYLDLVTLDDLSAEAMLESSQRMAQLGDIQRRMQSPLTDPGPATQLPPTVRNCNSVKQYFTLVRRSLIWSQPSSFIRYLFHILLAAIISFIVGAIFWDVPTTDAQLYQGDRHGFYFTILCVAHWPVIFYLSFFNTQREQNYIRHELNERLYGRTIYVFSKVVCSLPGSLFTWLSYTVPVFIMSGLHNQGSNYESTKAFYIYVGFMLIYFHQLQLLTSAVCWLFRPKTALFIIFIVFSWFYLFSGFLVHIADFGEAGEYLRMSSPTWWIVSGLLQREMRVEALNNHLICRNKQVQKQDIIVQVACPQPNGTAELRYHHMLPLEKSGGIKSAIFTQHDNSPFPKITSNQVLEQRLEDTFTVLVAFWIVSFLIYWLSVVVSTKFVKKKKKLVRSTNKP